MLLTTGDICPFRRCFRYDAGVVDVGSYPGLVFVLFLDILLPVKFIGVSVYLFEMVGLATKTVGPPP